MTLQPSFCEYCGERLPAGARFCEQCGAAVTPPAQTPVRPASPRPQPTPVPSFAQAPTAYPQQPYRQPPPRPRQRPNTCLIIFLVGLALFICLAIAAGGYFILSGGLQGIY